MRSAGEINYKKKILTLINYFSVAMNVLVAGKMRMT